MASPGVITPKAQGVLNAVDNCNKTVVFCQHVESARYITELLQQQFGAGQVVRLYAQDELATPKKLSKERRWQVIRDFESNPQIRAGVFSLNLAAEAIDLVAADQVLMYCLPWSATKLEQGLARVLRPGNRNPRVQLTYITHSWGIDKYQLMLLEQKVQIANLMLDYDTGLQESADVPDALASLSADVLSALGGLGGPELPI
jgi:superfamily II DNA or RNA helicase